ncbi:unnamed protein product [Effrenium voratum]|nr:unnamed protein product [Effrenium voratum]
MWLVRLGLVSAGAGCLQQYLDFGPPCMLALPATFRPHHEGRVEYLVREAVGVVRCCHRASGRAWELGLDHQAYLERVDDPTLRYFLDGGDGNMFGIFCGPAACEADAIGPAALHHFLAEFLHMPVADVSSPLDSEVSVVELSSWDQLPLDFVIAGAERCGTSSLQYNLFQHPEIDFTQGPVVEDYTIFMQGQRHKFVPTRKQLEQHLAQRSGKNTEVALVGLKNPAMLTYPLSYHVVAAMRTKMIAVVCDPLRRLEKLFMYWKFCHADHEAAVQRGDVMARAPGQRCYDSIRALLTWELQPWLRAQLLGKHLAVLMRIFNRQRLLVVHQASLRSPKESYNHIARWLGLGPFPATVFRRRQFRLGHRTDLCHNASLQAAMKRRLVSEYGVLMQVITLQSEFPQPAALRELQLHLSRCDDPEELQEGECGFYDKDNVGCPQHEPTQT